MPSEQPRLLFKQLKGFKAIENEHDKIETIAFLNAAREVVALIGKYEHRTGGVGERLGKGKLEGENDRGGG